MEVHSESTDGWWTAAIAGGREITVEDARRGTGEDPLHHMVQSLAPGALDPGTTGAEASHGPSIRFASGATTGYRMSRDALRAFTRALAEAPSPSSRGKKQP